MWSGVLTGYERFPACSACGVVEIVCSRRFCAELGSALLDQLLRCGCGVHPKRKVRPKSAQINPKVGCRAPKIACIIDWGGSADCRVIGAVQARCAKAGRLTSLCSQSWAASPKRWPQEQEMIGIWLQTCALIALGYAVTRVVFLTRAS